MRPRLFTLTAASCCASAASFLLLCCSSSVAPDAHDGSASHADAAGEWALDAVSEDGVDSLEEAVDALPVDVPAVCPSPLPHPPGSCPSLCGDGMIDGCGTWGHPPEECDGTLLNGIGCAGLYFAGGILRCGPTCFYDVSNCTSCLPDSANVTCRSPIVESADPYLVAIGAARGEIGVVWVDGVASDMYAHRFARLAPDLSVLSNTDCFGWTTAGSLSLVGTRSGWMVAAPPATGFSATSIWTLDGNGQITSTHSLPNGFGAVLTGSSTRGPLLTWMESGMSVHAVILGEDGSVATAPVTVGAGSTNLDEPAVVAVPDGFLIAYPYHPVVTAWSLGVWHLRLDGSLDAHSDVAIHGPVGSVHLAWTGSDVRLVWQENGMSWQRLSADGVPLGASASFGSETGGPIVTIGADTLVLEAPLILRRHDGTGALVPGDMTVGQVQMPLSTNLIETGGTLYAAWIAGYEGIYGAHIAMARITP